MKPHKHAEVIKAWADGVTIQWKDRASDTWIDWKSIYCLGFDVDTEYRVKPPKRELWVRPFNYTGVVSVSTSPRNDFDTAFSPRMWVGPAIKVWEESE